MNLSTSAPLDPEEDSSLQRSTLPFPVVGIGASAGGLQAVVRLLESLPAEPGMAFVVVLHLAPGNPSTADSILQRSTRMPVCQVVSDMSIQPNRVYVIPPNRAMSMNDGELRLAQLDRPATHHITVDHFFRSLGEVHQERAIAIVLSGAGADGAQGLRRVKERGGVAIVQSPADAEYDSMPLNAIAAGVADFVLPAADMGQQLTDLWANARRIELPVAPEDLPAQLPPTADAEDKAEVALQGVMRLLRERTGHDFLHYKRATLLRRIERRMQVSRQRTLPDYAAYLQTHAQEPVLLLQDMLISVTNFFRDRLAFEALERVLIEDLFENRAPTDRVRAWVAGCATGEEAYSVAMLLLEHASNAGALTGVQVFATDIDEKALAIARSGIYADSIATDIPPVRLRQFFERQPGQYAVSRLLRERITFSVHNLLRDPPFSRLDLVCCRNVLIYLDRPAQRQLLETFHFALRPGGLLFLGSAETADAAPEHFTVIDKKQRIYRASATALERRVPTALSNALTHLHVPEPVNVPLRRQLLEDIQAQLKAEQAPPAVVVDHQLKVVYLSEQANRFLRLHTGELSAQLLHLVIPELRLPLRAAIAHCQQIADVVHTRHVRLHRGDDPAVVTMTVRPVTQVPGAQAARGWLVVLFSEEEMTAAEDGGEQEGLEGRTDDELLELHRQLSAAIGESDSSSEALRASNEELQAVNEELRSTTEELETSKEELQSVNEELTTVNYDLKTHLEASAKANDDLQNFIAASEIATVFVDSAMRIQRFTPRAVGIFNLRESDIHRSLFDLAHRLDYPQMESDTREVFELLTPIEREIRSHDAGGWFLARLLPYRSSEDRIEGVVLNFIDITDRHKAEETVRLGEERLRLLFDSSVDYVIILLDGHGQITRWNKGAERALGYAEAEMLGKPAAIIFTPEDRAENAEEDERSRAQREGRAEDERWHLRKDGTRVYFSGVLVPLAGSTELGFAKIARDMTQTRLAEQQRDALLESERSLRAQLQEANAMKDQFLAVMSHELKNPLNLISLAAQLLAANPETQSSENLQRIAGTIRTSVKSQMQLIDDLLDLSRIQTGKLSLNLESMLCDDVVAHIMAAVRPEAETRNVAMQMHVEPGDYRMKADPVRIEQIVWNLVGNAIKFTPAGGLVRVQLQSEPSCIRLEVQDTGQGIDEAFLPFMFEMFQQADAQATVRGKGGLGIGLAIVKSLTEAHGGRVSVASPGLGKGSTFTVVLPRQNTDRSQLGMPTADGATLQSLRILLVDDDRDVLDMFGAILEAAGAMVCSAGSGEEALELATRQAFDLIVSDIGMPGMDGYTLIALLKKAGVRDVPVIAVTGFARPEDRAKALAAGFSEHMGKPLQYDTFLQAVVRLLPRSSDAAGDA
ncbi:CheR family methyltransferase [Acidovorax sp. NCPPB 4044]|uniref:CheR family methyltransferase n=1 Tax=Acidovorax sp. NCPPB 4044 TaxID=2940490 RepID=UPI0023032ABD|nr:CheR family methyltransferase [Acidovorax sp. NCPPB 4044]MDA8519896.1 PAS domain S-box protein [Acidovorax sp. NCPPB 4044]